MIRDFRHKGLERFFHTGNRAGVKAQHAKRLSLQLGALDAAIGPYGMNMPGWRLHPLKGDREGLWAVKVSGNWRIVFEFKDGHAYVVNYEDYH